MTSAPNRAISNRADAAAISSMAQQANPIGIGQSEFLRIQLIQASSLEKMMLPSILESYAAGAVVTIRAQYDRGHREQVKYFTRKRLVDAMVLPGCRMSSSLTKNETI
jgi:hypothetical protein